MSSPAPVSSPAPIQVLAYAAKTQGAPLEQMTITLPALQEDQVEVRVLCCGLCASDIDALGKYGGQPANREARGA